MQGFQYQGACKYYISPLGGGWVSEGNAYFANVIRGWGGGIQRQKAYIAYVKDQNSYSLEKGL